MIQLVKRSISGDADAFLELMEKNSLAMYKVARGILDNDEDAADAIQDTILTCFEKIHTLKNPEYFKTWMIRILINECNKIHRHYKNFSRAEELPEVPGQDMSIAEFEFKEMLGMLDEILQDHTDFVLCRRIPDRRYCFYIKCQRKHRKNQTRQGAGTVKAGICTGRGE